MAVAFVRSNVNIAGVTTSATCAFPSNNAGNLLVVAFEVGGNGNPTTVSDTAGNIWQTAACADTTAGWRLRIYYAENCIASAGTNTVTMTCSSAGYVRLTIAEYSGVGGSLSYSNSAGTNGSGTSLNSGSVAVTSGDLLVSFGFSLGGSLAAGGGYTSRHTDGFAMLADGTASGSSASATMTGGSGQWTILLAAFHASPVASQAPYAGGDISESLANTETAVFRSNTAGNLLIAVAEVASTTATISLSDTAGNTWVLITSVNDPSAAWKQAMYYVANCSASSGKNTVTVTFSGGGFKRISIAEYSGVVTSSPLIASASNAASGSNISSGSFASASGALVLAAAMFDRGAGVAAILPGSGYTSRKTDGFMMLEDKASTGSSETSSFVHASAGATIIAASFTSSAAAATVQPQMMVMT